MTNPSEAVRQRLRRGLDDRLEELWAAAREQGHTDCEGWQFLPEQARLICSCGEVIASEGKWGGSDA